MRLLHALSQAVVYTISSCNVAVALCTACCACCCCCCCCADAAVRLYVQCVYIASQCATREDSPRIHFNEKKKKTRCRRKHKHSSRQTGSYIPAQSRIILRVYFVLTLSTLLESQSRFGDKPVKFQVVCHRNGTAVLKG